MMLEALLHRPPNRTSSSSAKGRRPGNPLESLTHQVSRKIEAGDVKGAIQLANTENTLTEFSDNIVSALQSKHPSPHPNSSIPPSPSSLPDGLVIPASLVVKVINPSQMASLEVQTSYISNTCCQKTKLIRTHLSLHYWQANIPADTLFKSEQAISLMVLPQS